MGKHKFRLSDMMPNAWFYKLKDMNNHPGRKNHHPPLPNKTTQTPPPPPPPPIIPKRASYYFPSNSPLHPKAADTTHFPSPDSTPLSSTRRRRPPRRRKPLPTTTTHHLATTSPARLLLSAVSSSSSTSSSASACRASSSDETDVHSYCIRTTTAPPPPELDIVLDLRLRPILTKPPPAPPKAKNQPTKTAAGTSAATQPRLRGAASPGRKVRVAAPRRPPARSRRGIGESFAVVKSSSDPRRDFRESMVEMILENKLTASEDLEDLLACYLSLNSTEYHHVIVKVFQEIWLDITNFLRN